MIKPEGIDTQVWAKIYTLGERGESVTCEIYDDAVSLENPTYIFLFDAATAVGVGFLPSMDAYEDRNKNTALIIGLRGVVWKAYERYKATGIRPPGF